MSDKPTETRWVKYPFTDTDLLTLSKEMAQSASKKKEAEDRLKSVQTTIKAEITSEDGTINKCAEKIRAGYEMRPYVCVLEYDKKMRRVNFISKATGETIDSRPMTDEEQGRLV